MKVERKRIQLGLNRGARKLGELWIRTDDLQLKVKYKPKDESRLVDAVEEKPE